VGLTTPASPPSLAWRSLVPVFGWGIWQVR
jgi:hypothetical protein